MLPIVTSIEVNRSAEDVFDYATDPARFAEWQKGVVDGSIDNPGSPSVGTRCSTTRRIGFANRLSVSEVVSVHPPKTWSVRGIDGPIRAIVDVTVEDLADARTRLTISVDFEGRGIGKVLVPLVVRNQAQTEMPANLAVLKQRLERSSRK
jgi:hypothetical protein